MVDGWGTEMISAASLTYMWLKKDFTLSLQLVCQVRNGRCLWVLL